MALIEKLVGKVIRKGRLRLIMPDSRKLEFGPGDGKTLTVRLTDKNAAFAIARNPRLGLGEAYMDGRIVIEDGDILDLMELVTGANRWEDGGAGRKAIRKGKSRLKALFRARNVAKRARKNVAHHYDIGNDLYRLFLDDDLQYSCAYFTDPKNSLEQAQLDKKAHIAAKLALEAGTTCSGHRLRLGRDGALPEPRGRRPSHRRDPFRGATEGSSRARGGIRRRRPGEVRADRLPPCRGAVRPHRLDRHVRACRGPPTTTSSSPSAVNC